MSIWSQIPLVRLVIPFALGILAVDYFSFLDLEYSTYLFLVLGGASLVLTYRLKSYRLRWILGISVNLTMLIFGFCVQKNWQQWHPKPILENDKKLAWVGKVSDISYRSDSAYQLMVKANRVGELDLENQNIYLSVYFANTNPPKVGDWILGKSYLNEIAKPLNPYQFNYADFMANRGVYFQTYVDRIEVFAHEFSLIAFASEMRKKLLQNFEDFGIDGKELAVLTAISLGDKSHLEDDTRNAYAGAGAMHILAVSGLHVGIIFLIFNTLLKAFDKKLWQRLIKAIILLIVIWGFALLTGLAPSVQRAGCMFTFIVFSKLLNRHSNVLNSIAGAAFLLLILNPMMLFEVGFQLSFAAVIGIVSLHPIICDWWEAPNWFLDKAWSLLVVSICAQLFTLPFVLYYFHQFPNWFLLTNLFVIPLAFVIVAGALLVSVVGLLFNNDFYLADILEGVLWVLNSIIHQLQKLPFFVTDGIWISLLSAVCLAVFVLLLTYYLHELKYFQLFTALCCLLIAFTIEYALNLRQSKVSYTGVYALKDESVYLLKSGLRAEVIYRDSISDYAVKVVENHLSAINVSKVEIHNIKKSEAMFNLNRNAFLFCKKIECLAFVEKIEVNGCKFDNKQIRTVVASQLNSKIIYTNHQEIIYDGNVAAWNRNLKQDESSNQKPLAVALNGFERIVN